MRAGRGVSPNGHAHTARRRLREKGLRYILEVCRSMYAYARQRRNLPPYSENPFAQIGIERMRIEDAKPVFVFDAESELRFKKLGATAKRPIYGYVATGGSFDDWCKDSTAEEFILEGARILRETLNGAAVADYFRTAGVPVGPCARNPGWDGTMVLRFYRNPLLKGMPQRGRMATVKHHGTGKRTSRKNPKGPTYYHAPHLAFFTPEEFDDLVEQLATRKTSISSG